jgi:hypothetical protein
VNINSVNSSFFYLKIGKEKRKLQKNIATFMRPFIHAREGSKGG